MKQQASPDSRTRFGWLMSDAGIGQPAKTKCAVCEKPIQTDAVCLPNLCLACSLERQRYAIPTASRRRFSSAGHS